MARCLIHCFSTFSLTFPSSLLKLPNCYSCFIELKFILWNMPSSNPRLMRVIVVVVLYTAVHFMEYAFFEPEADTCTCSYYSCFTLRSTCMPSITQG